MTDKRMLSCREGMQYCGMGRNRFVEWAKEIGACRRFGRKNLYDVHKLDAGLDNLPECEARGSCKVPEE